MAAALASPETAERIAVLEAATSGGLSALDAAQLNVRRRRAGHDLALLNGLQGLQNAQSIQASQGEAGREEQATVASPLSEPNPEALPMTWKVVANGANGAHSQS